MVLAIYQMILHLNKITECLKMTTFKIVFTLDVFVSAETTMHCKVTCILYKKQAHFSQFFCLHYTSTISDPMTGRASLKLGLTEISSWYVFSYVICFRIIHFILISTAHALFLTCLPVCISECKQDSNVTSVKNVHGCF
jgi:hypothetical protein